MEIAEPEVTQTSRYQTERTLGAGGMGIVYLARDCKLHRPVAIKKLRSDATSASAQARIQSEARLLAKLNHRNIVQLYDVLEEDGKLALVMEYVEGTTLREWMREHRAGLREKLALLMQICEGLSEAHAVGIIHRDLKPDNILITHSGVPKITDFGIAKSQHLEQETLTQEDHVAGTVSAMSPEQIQGKTLDARSDLFSLGTIAYELLCGAKPFEKDEGGSLALANRIVSEAHIPPARAWANIPEPLAVLLDKLLSKNPALRPETAELVHQALELLLRQGADADTEEFSATLTDLLTRQPSPRRRLLKRLLGSGLALLVLGSCGYWGWKYLTRLEPLYIAVLPVEISGEIRGEDNAKTLTAAMVRQALTNAATQLQNTALVSFSPKAGDDLDTQLQALHNKGVTDALGARLLCAQTRCEIELQRLSPANGQIRQQSSFAFLAGKRQEAEYQIGNSAAALFPQSYLLASGDHIMMSDTDYNDYLSIVSRLESKENIAADLDRLEQLLGSYPTNPNIYKTFVQTTTDLFVLTGEVKHIQTGLDILERAKSRHINSDLILELELWLHTYSTDKSQFDALLKKFDQQATPTAALLAKYARFQYTQGDYEAGLHYAREAADLNPSADNLYLVALNQTAGGGYAEARKTLSRIVNLFPSHWSSYSALGVVELESGNLEAAETAITAIPTSLRGWRTASNLGVVYFLQQKYSEALATYQQVLDRVPNDIPTIGQIAETYLILGDTENARTMFEELLQLTANKEDLESRRYRALAKAYLDQASSAISLILELLREAPEDTDIKYNAAQIYALAGEWHSANYYLEELLLQGMSADWFRLPAFLQLCNRETTTAAVAAAVCQ